MIFQFSNLDHVAQSGVDVEKHPFPTMIIVKPEHSRIPREFTVGTVTLIINDKPAFIPQIDSVQLIVFVLPKLVGAAKDPDIVGPDPGTAL